MPIMGHEEGRNIMKSFFSQGNNRFAEPTGEEFYRDALLDDLRKAKEALETAYNGFDNVTEPELIDCYIYEINSVITRYNYLLERIGRLADKETKASRAVPVIAAGEAEKPLYSDLTGDFQPQLESVGVVP